MCDHPSGKATAILQLRDPSLLLLHEDVGETYDAVARSVAAAVGAETCHIALYDSESEEMIARRPRYMAPAHALPRYRFPLDSSPASARAVRTGQAYISNDPGHDGLYDAKVAENGVRCVLTVPVRRDERTLGLLYVLNKPGGFAPEDLDTATALAGAAAVTLENLRLYSRERDQRLLNESLREVSRALVGTQYEDVALLTLLDQMARVVTYVAAAALVLEDDLLRLAARRGGQGNGSFSLGVSAEVRRSLETRQLMPLTELAGLPELGLQGLAKAQALCAPLVAKGQVLGALVVAFDADHSPAGHERMLVGAFADHAALFLHAGALLRRERQARMRAAAVARITRISATRQDAQSLLWSVAPEMAALAECDRAVLYLDRERNGVLTTASWAGVEPEEEASVRDHLVDLRAGLLARVRGERKPVALDAEGAALSPAVTPFAGAQSLVAVPLVSRDDVLGLAVLACLDRLRRFDATLVELLEDAAQHITLGVENARLLARLTQMASTDDLTRLANRRRFDETLRLELARSRRTGEPLSLIVADVDELKRINDSRGHPAGDAAIRHVADALRRGRRGTDLAARIGGEEFTLLLPGTDLAGAVKAAERIRQELTDSPIPEAGTVTVSIGVATCPEDGTDEERLFATADERLYAAKAAGRNRVCHASSTAPQAVSAAAARPPSGG